MNALGFLRRPQVFIEIHESVPLVNYSKNDRLTISDCSIVYAIEAATLHPARCLKIDHCKGRLDFGCDADFVMLTDDLEVKSTWIAGECVFRKE